MNNVFIHYIYRCTHPFVNLFICRIKIYIYLNDRKILKERLIVKYAHMKLQSMFDIIPACMLEILKFSTRTYIIVMKRRPHV